MSRTDRHKNVIVSKRLVAINSASSIGARIINVTVLLWAYQYLLKRIPAEEFAVLPVVTSIMVVAPLFFSVFSIGIGRYVVDAYAKGEFDKVTGIVSSIFPLAVAISGVFLTVGLFFAANIEDVLNIAPTMVHDARIMMALLIVSFTLQMLAMPFSTGFAVTQRFVELNLIGVASDLLRISLLFILLIGVGPQVIWVVVATVAADATRTIIVSSRSMFFIPQLRFRPSLFDRGQARELMSFGMWTTLGKLGDIFYTNAATILLNLYGTAVDVTSYHVGATFFRQLDSTVNKAVQPLMPVLTAMNALEDKDRMARTVFRGGRYALWAVMAVATPLIVYADDFISLYLNDAEYSSAAVVIILFMIMFPFTKPVALLSMTAMATAQVKPFFLPAFLSKVLMFLIMLYMSWYSDLGAIGVTLSLTIVVIGMQIGYYWPLCLKMTGKNFKDFFSEVLFPGSLPAICGAVVWCVLKFFERPESWLSLLTYAVLGGFVYIAVLISFCLSNWERKDLKALLARFKATD